MKKKMSILLAMVLVLSIFTIGCGNKELKDGVYEKESELDDKGYSSIMSITVEDGKIVEADYNEIDDSGEKKTDNDEYSQAMEEAGGVSPEDAYEELEEALIKTQDPKEIDAVTGATGSSEKFINLTEELIKDAR